MFDTDEYRELHQEYDLWMQRGLQARRMLEQGAADEDLLNHALEVARHELLAAERAIYRYIWDAMGVKRPLERSR